MLNRSLLLSASAALLFSGTSAPALTADQVWSDIQALAKRNGLQIKAATEVRDGANLNLNGVTIGRDGQAAIATIAEVAVQEQADGSVVFAPEGIRLAPAGGQADLAEENLKITVFEDVAGLGYAAVADRLSLSFDAMGGAGEAARGASGTFALDRLNARYGRPADGMTLDMAASRLVFDLTQIDPAAMIDSTQTSDTVDLTLSGKLSIPEGVNLLALNGPAAFADALAAGMAVTGEMTQGLSQGTITERSPVLPMTGRFEAQPGTTRIAGGRDGLRLETSAPGLKMEMTPAGMPEAIPASMDKIAMTLAMPVVAPDGGEYQLALRLSNLVVGEAAWAMFDPTAALPREPADLALDLGGQAKLDLPAMMRAGEIGVQPPAPEPLTLDIRELGLKLAGAALSGQGAFTFDNAMLAMGGPPMPIGKANLRLEGGNRLIDGLIAVGLLAEQDAMGARMMLAMFGKPEGEDILTSEIEAREGGSIFVNGQQIQ